VAVSEPRPFFPCTQVNTAYSFDAVGRLVGTSAPSGSGNRNYTYDGASRLLTVSLNTALLSTTNYAANGEVASVQES
jgi:YD repeat-containing protein